MADVLYVARSWRNPLYDGVIAVLTAAKIQHYDFKHPAVGNDGFHWREIDPAWQAWSPRIYRESIKHPYAEAGFKADIEA